MNIERNLGPQPVARLLDDLQLTPHALVEASEEQLTHKMVARAVRGRRLTPHSKKKIVRAFQAATGKDVTVADLFNY